MKQVAIMVGVGLTCITILVLTGFMLNTKPQAVGVVVPSHYDKDYVEDVEGYELLFDMENTDWDSFDANPELVVMLSTNASYESRFTVQSMGSRVPNRSLSDTDIIMLSDSEAWSLVTNGIIQEYPSGSYRTYSDRLQQIKNTNTETITVKVWYWEDPNDDSNFSKVSAEKTFAVNSTLANMFTHIFEDIYNDPSQPVFNLEDKGMGTWVLRGKNHNSDSGISAHALGVAIDINPSTGSLKINGKWYGNGYGQNVMTAEMWNALPESHTKYHILYEGCSIVEIFKAYGFVWGGDWNSTKDPMHFSYIGDGNNARENGIRNYIERN